MIHRSLVLAVLTLGPAMPLALGQCESQKIPAPAPSPLGFFGAYLDESAGTVVVGANAFYTVGGRTAVVLEDHGGGFQAVAELAIPGGSTHFGTPVATSGDTVLLGDVDASGESGAVTVFERVAGVWSQTQVLTASTPLADAHFGRRVAVDEDRAAVAAPMDARQEYRGGAVYVFERVAGTWVEVERLTAGPPHAWGFYGIGLALEGDVLAVGEAYYHGSPSATVYVYRRGPAGWTLETEIVRAGRFGRSIDLDHGTLAVGDYGTGTVRLFREDLGWAEIGMVTAADAGAPYGFGEVVELDREWLVVGSASPEHMLDDGAHVFRRAGSTWSHVANLAPHDAGGGYGPWFGCALAITDGRLLVGSEADGERDAGAVYVYTLGQAAESYCGPANANSTGVPAVLTAEGCATLVENDLVLTASSLPPNQPGRFLVSATQGFVPFVGGGEGNLCLAGEIGRYPPSVSGSTGTLSLAFDADALPAASGSTSVQAGETWNFQAWFRDQNPGPTSNLTDGLAVLFR